MAQSNGRHFGFGFFGVWSPEWLCGLGFGALNGFEQMVVLLNGERDSKGPAFTVRVGHGMGNANGSTDRGFIGQR